MIELTIDLETIPDQTPGALEQFIYEAKANFKAPSSLTKSDAVAALGLTAEEAKEHSKESAIALFEQKFAEQDGAIIGEQEWRKTSFDGTCGQIAVIGWKLNDGSEHSVMRNSPDSSDEIRLLNDFYTVLGEQLKDLSAGKRKATNEVKFIGHYIEGFDLPFLFKRSVICKVKPCLDLKISRYSENLFDTCSQWAGFNGRVKLDALCKALGVESPKNDIDGSKVWDYICQGKIAEVAEYCKGDVRATYEVYKRLTFAGL